MGTCKDCKHFKFSQIIWLEKQDRGTCDMTRNYNFVSSYKRRGLKIGDTTKAYAYDPDSDGRNAVVIVGIDFGCIHFNKKEG